MYDPVEVEVPFSIDPTKQPQFTVIANYATVKTIAMAQMYQCSLGDVDVMHVRDMFETLEVEGV